MFHEAEEIELPVGPLRLAARVHGPADGIPVLALHGWLDNAASFEPLAPLLKGLRLVALDLPGHGHSDHRAGGTHYHFIDYVEDVLGAVDALGWERFALLGHSLGGAVATFVAGACPDRVTRLGLIEALGPLTEHPDEAPRRLAHALDRARVRGDRPARTYPAIEQAIQTGSRRSGPRPVCWSSAPRSRSTAASSGAATAVCACRRRIASPKIRSWPYCGRSAHRPGSWSATAVCCQWSARCWNNGSRRSTTSRSTASKGITICTWSPPPR